MNYYERIQNSINYIEANLEEEITIEQCASEAFMSLSGYYRIFLSIVGYNVKEYIRLRRLTRAYAEMESARRDSVIAVATKYEYQSADSFTRAFKKQFGILPSKVRNGSQNLMIHQFGRINVMEKYFETENKELLDKYPDIKVIRDLEEMKVACYTYFGPDPEGHAFETIKEWIHKNRLSIKDSGYRIFGYNHPDPSNVDDAEELYGYEVCVTIPDALYETLEDVPEEFEKGTYNSVMRRTLEGGKYAVMSVRRDADGDIGMNIMRAWKRFSKWLDEGKYIWGGRQYLEEHLGFSDEDDHIGGVELYISIENAPQMSNSEMMEVQLQKERIAMFRTEGSNVEQAAKECWGKAINWARENGIKSEKCHIYQYNKGFDRRPPFFHVIMITLPQNFDEKNCNCMESVTFKDFEGGKFMTVDTDYQHLGTTWMEMEKWRKDAKAKAGNHQWIEEWFLKNWSFPSIKIKVYYPIQSGK